MTTINDGTEDPTFLTINHTGQYVRITDDWSGSVDIPFDMLKQLIDIFNKILSETHIEEQK